jgi:hypothetical protein
MLRLVTLVRTDDSEEPSASIIRVTRIDELGTTLAVTSNGAIIFLGSVSRLLITANVVPISPILVTLMIERLHPSKSLFLQEPHGVTYQKTAFFLVITVKTSNLA